VGPIASGLRTDIRRFEADSGNFSWVFQWLFSGSLRGDVRWIL